jgi:hypothetical protein
MSWIVPWVAAAFALFGLALLPVAAFLGVTPQSDDVLNGAQTSLVVAALLFLSYMFVGMIREFARTK